MSTVSLKTFLRSLLGGPAVAAVVACRNNPPAPGASATAAREAASQAPASPPIGRTDKLVERTLNDVTAAWVIGEVYIGDQLGLFKAMSGAGPVSAGELAAKTAFDIRYVGEWLRTMATSGQVDYHPASGSFELTPEHAAVLVDEDSPAFPAGFCESVVPDILMIPRVLQAFKSGTGISNGDYPAETLDSIERSTRPDYLHLFAQQWIPAVPGMADRLRAGGRAKRSGQQSDGGVARATRIAGGGACAYRGANFVGPRRVPGETNRNLRAPGTVANSQILHPRTGCSRRWRLAVSGRRAQCQ